MFHANLQMKSCLNSAYKNVDADLGGSRRDNMIAEACRIRAQRQATNQLAVEETLSAKIPIMEYVRPKGWVELCVAPRCSVPANSSNEDMQSIKRIGKKRWFSKRSVSNSAATRKCPTTRMTGEEDHSTIPSQSEASRMHLSNSKRQLSESLPEDSHNRKWVSMDQTPSSAHRSMPGIQMTQADLVLLSQNRRVSTSQPESTISSTGRKIDVSARFSSRRRVYI